MEVKPIKCKCCGERGFPKNNSTIGYYCEKEACQDARIKKAQIKKVNAKFNQQPIRKVSIERGKENKAYMTLREVFLKDKICPITGQPATEVHHKKGRIGKLLCDVKYWLAVSREGHIKIENNPEWAKEQGYSLSRLA